MEKNDEAALKYSFEQLLFTLGLVGACLTAVTPFLVVPQFHEVFLNFGAELPLFTRLVADYYWLAALLPVAVLAAWFYWPNRRRRSIAAAAIGLGSLVLVVPVIVFAMYLPIFKLSATI